MPLFVSHRTLRTRKKMKPTTCEWALDSGGFTELSMHGRWLTSEVEYVDAVARYSEMGRMEFAAPMDWMCEPWILEKTGLSVQEHQERTVENFLSLRDQGPFIPVLQGYELDDYVRCFDLYSQAGVDLHQMPLVGLGSVCRRQHLDEISELIDVFSGLKLHGFGMKIRGVAANHKKLASADSMGWSLNARWGKPLPGHTHKACNNCIIWAMQWRNNKIIRILREGEADV